MIAFPFTEKLGQMIVTAGDYMEKRIGDRIESSEWNAPELTGSPEPKVWYKIPLEHGISGDGSGYHIYLKQGTTNRLCIFFSGGGVAWDDYSAARPVTGGKVIAGQSNFYWNNLRPFTQIMNINVGITETDSQANPFDSWSFIVVTYATGDFHVGNKDYTYETEEGTEDIVHLQGHRNFKEAMKVAKEFFPAPKRLLIAGDSAGAFAVPALAGEVLEDYYPDCQDVTLLSDSALLIYDGWQSVAKDFWGADERFWKPLTSGNIYLDWFRDLIKRHGDRVQYLYASSVEDYLLSAFHNAINNGDYSTNSELQDLYREELKEMIGEMREIAPKTAFFLNRFPQLEPGFHSGGTAHTAVRKPFFHVLNNNQATMARWLFDATQGEVYDVGMEFLEKEKEKEKGGLLDLKNIRKSEAKTGKC